MVRLSQESDRLPQNSTDSFLKYLPEESSYRMIHTLMNTVFLYNRVHSQLLLKHRSF